MASKRVFYSARANTTGLSDVKINIWNGAGTQVVTDGAMTEIGTHGTYYYDYTYTTSDNFLAVMDSTSKPYPRKETFSTAASDATPSVAAATDVTVLQVIQDAGINKIVVDENLGTGDNANDDFDIANDNLVAGSYTLSHAASGSNDFTDLTETTHYSIDRESGRVLLTATGITEVGTDVLYASYEYVEDLKEGQIEAYIVTAKAEANEKTGRTWYETQFTELQNGRPNRRYPESEYPYAYYDTAKDYINLREWPVITVDSLFFLKKGQGFDKVFYYDDSGSSYTDLTDNVNDPSESDSYLYGASPGNDDIVYFGSAYKFLSVQHDLPTLATGSPVIVWEYYNELTGDWATLSVSESTTDTSKFKANGENSWTLPAGWAKTTVNGTDAYWVRAKATTAMGNVPVIDEAFMGQNNVIDEEISRKDVVLEEEGRLTFINSSVPYGDQNIKAVYTAGYAAADVPELVKSLVKSLTSLRCFIALSGGSYDNFTSAQAGNKSVTIGEQYVNIREVIDQKRKVINSLLSDIGNRVDIVVA